MRTCPVLFAAAACALATRHSGGEPARKPPVDVVAKLPGPSGAQKPPAGKALPAQRPAPAAKPPGGSFPRPAPWSPAAAPGPAAAPPQSKATPATADPPSGGPAVPSAEPPTGAAALERKIDDLRHALDSLFVEGQSTAATVTRLLRTVERLEQQAAAERKARLEPRGPEAPPPVEPAPIGIGAEVHWATAYAFRGLNVFRESSQADMNSLFNPALSWAIADSGVALTYSGYFQATGGNRAELVAVGVGHEQDLVIAYTKRHGDLTGSTGLTYYAYPFAKEAAAGTRWPSYVEPAVSGSWAGPIEPGLQLLYFRGVQSELAAASYAYVHPTLGKTFKLVSEATLSASLGGGYKIFSDDGSSENRWDAHFDWKLTFPIGGGGYVAPAIHCAWTDLKSTSVGEELFVWSGIATGIAL